MCGTQQAADGQRQVQPGHRRTGRIGRAGRGGKGGGVGGGSALCTSLCGRLQFQRRQWRRPATFHIAHLPAASVVACAAAAQAEQAQRAAPGLPKAGQTRHGPPLQIAAAGKPAF